MNMLNCTNDTSFTNFSAVTESTRITPLTDDNNTTTSDDDVTQMNDFASVSTNTVRNFVVPLKYRSQFDKREDTSNWIKDLDEENTSTINRADSDLEPESSMLRVRVVPNTFSPNDFVCQKLELLDAFEQLQVHMNNYYQNMQSCEYDDQSEMSMQQNLVDSLELNSVRPNVKNFLVGDYCAAKIGSSWSRCKILDIDQSSKIAHVECVDDCRMVRVQMSKLERLYVGFQKMNKLGFRCKLSGLDSSTKLLALNSKAIDKFKTIINEENKELLAQIVECKEEDACQIYEVNLFIDNMDIIQWFNEISCVPQLFNGIK